MNDRPLEAFFHSSSAGLALVDERLRVTEANRSFTSTRRDYPNLIGELAPLAAEALASRTSTAGEVLVHARVDGRAPRRFHVACSPTWRGGRPVSVAVVTTDLGAVAEPATAQRHLEEQERTRRLESLGRLTGGVAHDFNNLLMVIMANAEVLKHALPNEGGSEQSLYQYADEILSCAARAGELTHSLLAFGRQQSMRLETFPLQDTLEHVGKMLTRLLPASIQLEIHADRALPPVRADRAQLEQVALNLCLNARDAMPHGGTLRVHTVNHVHPVDWLPEGDDVGRPLVGFVVSDTGTGMSQAVLEKLFEPFFTTKPVDRGTGLGLAIVDGIVAQLDGRVLVESEVGEGSRITVLLPLAEASREPRSPIFPRREFLAPGRTVLICEDDAAVRRSMRRDLGDAELEVLVADGPRRAIELAQSRDAPLDVIIADVDLPGYDGVRLATELRRMHPEAGVLLVSGYPRAETRSEELAGASFLAKPFTRRALHEAVQRVLERQASGDDAAQSGIARSHDSAPSGQDATGRLALQEEDV